MPFLAPIAEIRQLYQKDKRSNVLQNAGLQSGVGGVRLTHPILHNRSRNTCFTSRDLRQGVRGQRKAVAALW